MYSVLNHIPKSINKLHKSLIVKSAQGSWVTTIDNRKYLDLTSGIGALSTGHSHPYIIKKVKEQLEKYVHIPQQVYGSHEIQIELVEKMKNIMPNTDLDNIFYVNSGSEATNNAIKIARRYTKKTNVISLNKGFHGRTLGALSYTSSNLSCKLHSQPLIPGAFFCSKDEPNALLEILENQSSPDDTCAFIIEPVLGEGGVISIDKGFLEFAREICTKNNILLIADEVQCGSGRTGSWWNIEQKNIKPDIITLGKGIASGFPLAGVVSTSEIMNNTGMGYLGGTYGGNAVCSAAASATIDVFKNENILENVKNMEKYFLSEFSNLKNIDMIENVRAYGLMIAIELNDKSLTLDIVNKLNEKGVLVLLAGNKSQYIRLLPPLNISMHEIDIFIDEFNSILNSYKD